ncbi:hypothetical protein PISMIDRAFT_679568 [Pisolithus microcarpus 441]|uniref:Uncharacterized protein n=1 Tax=Pisolithus microcarpus 441 TaxID=765257 RepID=A0A0C9Z2M9_9AGAM|nr:hypothetical protein PISMIDRAFT_687289 [Pisolithus microcarpus 441]KIK23291.1 hypothetical protein PISMIDRAFT_679568 [Pisolithus microcarpus 441]
MPSFAEPPFQKYKDFDDGTIISGEHVIRSIQEFESKVKVIKTEHGDAFVYALRSNDKNAKTYKIVIGPLEIDIAVDLNKLTIVIEVYAHIPFVGKVQIAKTSGNLRKGITFTIGFPPFIGGSLTLKLDGKDVVLEYSFDAFGLHFGGVIVIFTLP